MHTRTTLIAGIVFSLVVAGCIAPSPPGANTGDGDDGSDADVTATPRDGLSLTFRAPGSPYQEGQDIALELLVENTGEQVARDITARTTGIHFVVDTGSSCPQDPADGFSLQPVRGNQRGQTQSVVWSCDSTSVDLDQDQVKQFPAGVTVAYEYASDARATITAVPESEYEGDGTRVQVDNAASPVHAAFEVTSPQPVTPGSSLTVPVTIENVGPGKVVDGTISNIRTDASPLQCPSSTTLYQGTSTISCTLPSSAFSGDIRTDVNLQITFEYRYEESTQGHFSIRGLPGSP